MSEGQRGRDEIFMARALEVARIPARTSPNPRVGAIVVRGSEVSGFGISGSEIISEGWHEGPGRVHAEAAALAAGDAAGATLYTNLEPCVHFGRTPPCVDAILEAGVARVVAALEDPDPRVQGRGVERLRSAGVEVDVGTLAAEATFLNAPYLHHRSTGRSWLTLKLALTLDGKLAGSDRVSKWITGESSRRRVHARRLEADAVLIGSGTVLADDPRLTVRAVPATAQPLRVILDRTGRVPADAKLFRDVGVSPVVIATTERSPHDVHTAWKQAGAEVLVLPERGLVETLTRKLAGRGVLEIYCEGGATLAASLLRDDLVDRLELYYGSKLLGAGLGLEDLGAEGLAEARAWHLEHVERLDDDVLAVYSRGRG